MKKTFIIAISIIALAGVLSPAIADAKQADLIQGVVNPEMHGICAYFIECDPWKITQEQYDAYFNYRANGVEINQIAVKNATQIRILKEQVKELVLRKALAELIGYGIDVK